MQLLTIRTKFEAFECKFEPFERDSKQLNANPNHSQRIRSIQLQIRTIRKDSKHLNANSNHSKGIRSNRMHIRTIRKGLQAFECKFEPFERDQKNSRIQIRTRDSKHSHPNSNQSKGIRSIRLQIRTIRKPFECKFEPFKRDSNANLNRLKRTSRINQSYDRVMQSQVE